MTNPDRQKLELRNPDEIRRLLLMDPYLHLYELGDLDPFFWPSTQWFVREGAVALLYTAAGSSVVICLTREPEPGRALLHEIRDQLPEILYSHLTPGLFEALESRYEPATFGEYQKMSLKRPVKLALAGSGGGGHGRDHRVRGDHLERGAHGAHTDRGAHTDHDDHDDHDDHSVAFPRPRVVQLLASDCDEVRDFYRRAYPANWFDPRMLETERYFGIRDEGGGLLAIAGIHVYSPREAVGVLGNVATLPEARGRGLGTRVCRELCRTLDGEGLRIGLNVARDNRPAIRCYESLGFVHEADYEERSLRRRRASDRVSE